jgi:hypothetical protein
MLIEIFRENSNINDARARDTDKNVSGDFGGGIVRYHEVIYLYLASEDLRSVPRYLYSLLPVPVVAQRSRTRISPAL